MELDILHQILNELKELKQGQVKLEQGQAVMQTDISNIKAQQDVMLTDIANIKAQQDVMLTDIANIKAQQDVMLTDILSIKIQQAIDSESIDIIIAEIGKINRNQKTHNQEIEKLRATS